MFTRISVIFIFTCLFFPSRLLAVTETSGVSAVVAKAQFETSVVSVESQEDGSILQVNLVNSGNLNAQTVSVFVLYPDVLAYTGATQEHGTITTQGSSLGQFIEWTLVDVEAGEQNALLLSFQKDEDIDVPSHISFSVSIVSHVSIPIIRKVTIGADSDSFAAEPDRLQKFLNAYAIRYFSFKRWLVLKLFSSE